MCQDVQRTISLFSLSKAEKSFLRSGALCVEHILGQNGTKDFPSTGRMMHDQSAAARLHCRLLIQSDTTTEMRKFIVQHTLDLSLVSREKNSPQKEKKK